MEAGGRILHLTGRVVGETAEVGSTQVGAFSARRAMGNPVSWARVKEDGTYGLVVPPGSWYLHAAGGPPGDGGFLHGSVWGSYGGPYGAGRPVAVCHYPISGLNIHLGSAWRDLLHVPAHRQPILPDYQRRVVRLVQAALARDPAGSDVDSVASRVGLSRSRLSALFKRATGLTMGEYRRRLLVEAARALLADTDADVLDVALELGYGSTAALERAFRGLLGSTPGQFADVAGHVSYGGSRRGIAVYVMAIPHPHATAYPVVWTGLPGPGAFTLDGVPPGRYFILAFYMARRVSRLEELRGAIAFGAHRPGVGASAPVAPVLVAPGMDLGYVDVELVDGSSAEGELQNWTPSFLKLAGSKWQYKPMR